MERTIDIARSREWKRATRENALSRVVERARAAGVQIDRGLGPRLDVVARPVLQSVLRHALERPNVAMTAAALQTTEKTLQRRFSRAALASPLGLIVRSRWLPILALRDDAEVWPLVPTALGFRSRQSLSRAFKRELSRSARELEDPRLFDRLVVELVRRYAAVPGDPCRDSGTECRDPATEEYSLYKYNSAHVRIGADVDDVSVR